MAIDSFESFLSQVGKVSVTCDGSLNFCMFEKQILNTSVMSHNVSFFFFFLNCIAILEPTHARKQP